jgi:cytoskeletal protein CcmA (bactofilin family)
MAQPRTASSTSASSSRHSASTPATIGAGTRVRGRVTGDGDVTIEGRVEGEVNLRGELVIAEGGAVVSDVEAESLRVEGSLEGDANIRGDVVILAGAKVRGDLRGASITLDLGADLDGRLDSEFTLPRELAGPGAK